MVKEEACFACCSFYLSLLFFPITVIFLFNRFVRSFVHSLTLSSHLHSTILHILQSPSCTLTRSFIPSSRSIIIPTPLPLFTIQVLYILARMLLALTTIIVHFAILLVLSYTIVPNHHIVAPWNSRLLSRAGVQQQSGDGRKKPDAIS